MVYRTLITTARMRFFLGLGLMIFLACFSMLRQHEIAAYEVAILMSVVLAALVFDYLKVGQFLKTAKEFENARCSHDLAIRKALAATLKFPLLLKLLETELLTLYYAFFAKFEGNGVTNKNTQFSYTKASNAHDVFMIVALSQLPFLPFIHILIEHKKGPGPAWLVTLLTLWSVVWYLAQVEATRFRPIELNDENLKYRFGLFWTADIPLSNITTARSVDVAETLNMNDYFLSPLGSAKNVILEFEAPTRFTGPYMLKRRATKAAITLDNPNRFLNQLAQKGVATG